MDNKTVVIIQHKLNLLLGRIDQAIDYEARQNHFTLQDLQDMRGDVEGYIEHMATVSSTGWAYCLPRFNKYFKSLKRRYQ